MFYFLLGRQREREGELIDILVDGVYYKLITLLK